MGVVSAARMSDTLALEVGFSAIGGDCTSHSGTTIDRVSGIFDPMEIRPSVCPLDCPDRCALDVTVDAGKVVKIDGSSRSELTDGFICAKVRGFGKRQYAPGRL